MNDAAHDLAGLPEPLTHESPADDDYHRRFGGVARLYGAAGLARLEAASVCVVGIGGVGSWAAEALARNAVGRITLIDLDHIALSNTNRQIHALGDAYGRAKVEAMAERIVAINPRCQVTQVDDFVTPDNVPELLGAGYDYVIDAIDAVRVKTGMLGWARRQGVPVITCGGAGGQLDPTRVRIDAWRARSRTRCCPRCAPACASNGALRATRRRSSALPRSIRTSRCNTRNPSSRPARSTRRRRWTGTRASQPCAARRGWRARALARRWR